jgi:hypothetical protein
MWGRARPGRAWSGLGPALVLLITAVPAQGQGSPLECRDRQSRLIRVQTDRRIAYPAIATFDGEGVPVIYWNPKSTNGRSEIWRRFVLLHECGHILLRHLHRTVGTVEDRRRSEAEADCHAIQALAESKETSGSQLSRLFRELERTKGDLTHLGGRELVFMLERCLDARTDAGRWHEALDQLLASSADSFTSITGLWLGQSWAGQIYEATIDLPGTFDCEIRPPRSFVCLLMTAEAEKPARRRFQELRRIVQSWLPSDWTHAERATSTSLAELFLAQSSTNGTFMALVRTTADRLYFVARPADR